LAHPTRTYELAPCKHVPHMLHAEVIESKVERLQVCISPLQKKPCLSEATCLVDGCS